MIDIGRVSEEEDEGERRFERNGWWRESAWRGSGGCEGGRGGVKERRKREQIGSR